MKKDMRKEQLALLRVEKQIAGVAAALAAGAGAAKAADGKLHAVEGGEAYAEIQSALVHLAEVTSKAHASLNEQVIEAGARVLSPEVRGLPKEDVLAKVISILGLG